MKIGIDMLPVKTSSIKRGIGKYTYNLIKTLVSIDNSNQYFLFNVPDSYVKNFEKNNVKIFKKDVETSYTKNLDAFVITNLIEYESETSIDVTKIFCKKILIFYDLIPLIFWKNYLGLLSDEAVKEYFKRLYCVKKFDLIFSISNTTKKDLVELLAIPQNKIFVIYGGIDEEYLKNQTSKHDIISVFEKYKIRKKFILSTPGYDYRKNMIGIFNAYAELPENLKKYLILVIVCELLPHEEQNLRQKWSTLGLDQEKLILTNYIPVKDLTVLYDSAELFLFPSLYEGFGLPVLESMVRGCPVITSKISSLPEVCENAALYVNPYDPADISSKIQLILEDKNVREGLIFRGFQQYPKFYWHNIAKKMLTCIENEADKIEPS